MWRMRFRQKPFSRRGQSPENVIQLGGRLAGPEQLGRRTPAKQVARKVKNTEEDAEFPNPEDPEPKKCGGCSPLTV
ncbi:hypothetical protein EYF80_067737 [Liparis tanakae]|uniref:Uncharacterized protein n=1 Tax=Liparis tanakae TaxID=230148 RepID=A0A4Z2E090_9TELE|nr:hypothetical protein EYF80_067737 [Liparis tanakae]